MDIRKEILEALSEYNHIELDQSDYEAMTDAVYSRLANSLGSVQEKLMNDLTEARTSRAALQTKFNALSESYAVLYARTQESK